MADKMIVTVTDVFINNVGLGQSDLEIKLTKENHGHIGIAFDSVVAWVSLPPEIAIKLATEIIRFSTDVLADNEDQG